MARVLEHMIAIKIARIVKDADPRDSVIDISKLVTLLQNLPDLVESVIDDQSVIVELVELD